MEIDTEIHEFLHSNECSIGTIPLNLLLSEDKISILAQLLEFKFDNKSNYLNQVEEFHKTFNHPVNKDISQLTLSRMKLRISLIQEELDELIGGFEHLKSKLFNIESSNILEKEQIDSLLLESKVEIADALGDLMYVLVGTILECGLKDKFNEVFSEIHRSNMSKACDTLEEAEATKKKYEKTTDNKYFISPNKETNKYLVYREDSKLIKNVNYSPANLLSILK